MPPTLQAAILQATTLQAALKVSMIFSSCVFQLLTSTGRHF
jgi:hypothetical protein